MVDANTDAGTVGFQITVDAHSPARLARFWVQVLGYVLEPPPAGFPTWNQFWRSVGVPDDELSAEDEPESIVDPTGTGPRWWFQPVPEAKVVKNRVHFDIDVSAGRAVPLDERRTQVDAAAERLVAAGATRVRQSLDEGGNHYHVVMQDPEGNEFCLR